MTGLAETLARRKITRGLSPVAASLERDALVAGGGSFFSAVAFVVDPAGFSTVETRIRAIEMLVERQFDDADIGR